MVLSGQTYRPITNSFKSGHIAVTGPTYTRFSLTKRLSGRVWLSRLSRPPTPPSTHPQQQQPPRFSFITGSSVCGALARIHPCAVELPDSWQTCNRSLCFFFFFMLPFWVESTHEMGSSSCTTPPPPDKQLFFFQTSSHGMHMSACSLRPAILSVAPFLFLFFPPFTEQREKRKPHSLEPPFHVRSSIVGSDKPDCPVLIFAL